MRSALRVLVLLVVLALTFGGAGAPSAAAPVIVGEDELAVTVAPETSTAEATVTVLNGSADALDIDAGFAGASAPGVTARTQRARLEAGEVKRMTLTFRGVGDLKEPVSGAVVVEDGSAASAREVTITPQFEPTRDWPATLVIVSFVIAAVVVLVVGSCNFGSLGKKAPGPSWTFDSYATTLTALGGLLAAVLGDVTFPERPERVDEDTVIALSLLFAALVVAGPFLFQALRNPAVSPADADGMWGFNATLLLACGVTFAAVLGQLMTLALLTTELVDDRTWTTVALVAFALGAASAVYYFVVTAAGLSSTNWEQIAENAQKAEVAKARQAGKAGWWRPSPRWW